MESEEGIEFRLRFPAGKLTAERRSVLLVVLNEDEAGTTPEWVKQLVEPDQLIVICEPRGVGATKWTVHNPPNYVERSHVLLGRTVDTGRVWDVIAAVQSVRSRAEAGARLPVHVAGRAAAGLIAAYAAALSDEVAGVKLVSPPSTHMSPSAPQVLNVLRVCDVPDVLGLVAPRPLALIGGDATDFSNTLSAYSAAGSRDQLVISD
jgi:hypothetical protein